MRKLVGNSAKWVSRMRTSWDSILVENPGRVQPDRFGPPASECTFTIPIVESLAVARGFYSKFQL